MNPKTPRRLLAVDFGDQRTGLAATDWTGSISVPLPRLEGLDDRTCAARIAAIAAERESETIVIGIPLRGDGGEGERAQRTRAFVAVLRGATTLPIEMVDESNSTDEAHARLKDLGLRAARRKQVADSVAALVILERFQAQLGDAGHGRVTPRPHDPEA